MSDAAPTRHIVAAGGWSFGAAPDDPALNQYILDLAGVARPRVCFVPTASGDAQDHIIRFYSSFTRLSCVPTHLTLFNPGPPTADLRSLILDQQVIVVGGGNTKNLLALWREWGLDAIFREAWERGIVLSGVSAGAICWFEDGITDSIPGPLTPLKCLGYLKGANCPHYDREAERRPTFHRLLLEGRIAPGYAAEDGVALHFVGERLERAVSARPEARAFWVEQSGEAVTETPLELTRIP
ncbi:MAG TPA: peptidase E [Ktedonobacterales bacterium]|nr:peptidase E [Ktedonobacterales bacterium]